LSARAPRFVFWVWPPPGPWIGLRPESQVRSASSNGQSDAVKTGAKMELDTVGLAGPIDPARVEPLPVGHLAKHEESFGALKAQIRALMDDLAAQVRHGLDASQIKMRIDQLSGRSAS
jgi:hypothetical protein